MLDIQDITYSGKAAEGFVLKAITGADTIQGGNIMIQSDIRKQVTIPTLDISADVIQPRVATPTTGTDTTINGVTITPQDLMVYQEFNPRDFEQHWQAEQLAPSLLMRGLPTDVSSFMVTRIFQKVAKEIESLIWRGDTSLNADLYPSLSRFDGLIKQLKAASGTLTVSGAAVLTASNVIAQMQAVYTLLPDALKFNQDTKLFVSYKTAALYQTAQQNVTYKGVSVVQGAQWELNGLRVVKCAGMPDDTILATIGQANTGSNLWMGMNNGADDNTVTLDRLQNNSELWFVKMLMKAAVKPIFPDQAVLYSV